ncbi:MAG: YciI family protein [Bacteroidota bacterium]
MKDFMLIFIGKPYSDMDLSPEQMQQQMGRWWEWQTKMEEKGILKGGHALRGEVRTISGAERTTTDRTSAELKELVGGYYIVSAANVEEASQIAEGYPDYDLGGTVEVREVMVYDK